MHKASTAQEVKIITPTAKDLEFRVSISGYLCLSVALTETPA